MPRHKSYVPHGVIPAVLLPFDEDLVIDEASFRKHLRDVAATAGHLRDHHQRPLHRGRLLHLRRAAPRPGPSPRTRSAAACRWSTASGPTAAWRPRASPAWRPRAALPRCWCSRRHPSRSASRRRWRSPTSSASPTPPTCRSSSSSIRSRPARAIPRTRCCGWCEEVPTIRAIKDWIGNVPHHEWHIRTLQSLPRPVNVLSTHSAWLFSSAGARLQRPALRQRQRHPRPAVAAVPARCRPTISPRRAASTTASSR